MFRRRVRRSRVKRGTNAQAPLSRQRSGRRFELLEPRHLLAHNILVAFGGLTSIPAGATTFADTGDYTIAPSAFNTAGADIVLRANNDITFGNFDTFNNNHWDVRAGRSIILSGTTIISYDKNLTLVANETTANGVQAANRDAGTAIIDVTSDAYAYDGNISILLNTGAGLADSTSGNIRINGLNAAGHILVRNSGPTAGSSIVGVAGALSTTATSVALDVDGAGGGGSIGNASVPIRISGTTTLSARAQGGGAFFSNGFNDVTIGNATLGGLHGISTSNNGPIFFQHGFGRLILADQLNAGGGNVYLSAHGTLAQSAGSTITANALSVTVPTNRTGPDLILDQANNVSIFAATNSLAGGKITLNSTVPLTIGTVVSPNTGIIGTRTGITTSGGNVTVTSPSIAIGQLISTSGGNLYLSPSSPTVVSAPGNGTDVNLGANGTMSFGNGSQLSFTINGATEDTGYQQLHLIGKIDLAGVSLTTGGTYAPQGETYTLIDNDLLEPIAGNFTGLPEGSSATVNGRPMTVTYHYGTDNNDLVLLDAPRVMAVYPADAAGVPRNHPIAQDERESLAVAKLVIVFSENMTTSGPASIVNPANWQLRRNGVDVSRQITGITFGHNPVANRYEALISFTAPLAGGHYELTARSSLTDSNSVRLDGDLLGSGFGEDYVHHFSIAAPSATGSEFRVNGITVGHQYTNYFDSSRSIASSGNGTFVSTWTSTDLDGNGTAVMAKRYDPFGVVLSEFRANVYTTGSQERPSVAMNSGGEFVITWTSEVQDGNQAGIYVRRYSASGSPPASEFRVNLYTTGFQTDSRVALDSGGNFIVTWSSYGQDGSAGGVYARRFSSSGAAIGTEFRVNSSTAGNQGGPSVAMNPDGKFVITWQSEFQDGESYGVYAQRYTATGATDGSEFRVNNTSIGSQAVPAVVMDATGNFVITWTSQGQSGDPSDVYARRYSAAGAALGSEFRVNSTSTGVQAYGSIAADADGDFTIAWESWDQDGDGAGIFAQRFDGGGNRLGSEFQVNSHTVSSQLNPSVAMDSDSDFVIAWTSKYQDGNGYGVYAQRFAGLANVAAVGLTNSNTPIEPGERLVQPISAAGNLTVQFSRSMSLLGGAAGANSVINPANWTLLQNGVNISSQITSITFPDNKATFNFTSALGDGAYQLTASGAIQDADGRQLDGDWDGSPGGNFSLAFSIAQPIATGSEFRVNTYTTGTQASSYLSGRAVASDADGNFIVAWSSFGQDGDGYGVYARRFNAAGMPLGNEFRVNTYTTNQQDTPAIAMNSRGDFVIAWESSLQDGSLSGVFAQRYSAAGVPQGSEFAVNTRKFSLQSRPSVAIDEDGDFVIAWNTFAWTSDSEIAAQRFSASGQALGSEFLVNTYTTDTQLGVDVAMDAEGNFVVAWDGEDTDGITYAVFARRYSAAGEPLGTQFRVASSSANTQNFSSIDMDDEGNFVISWQDNKADGTGGYGIYARRFNSEGVNASGDFRAHTFTTFAQRYSRVAMDTDGDFVIVWQSDSQDGGGEGIFGQRFNSAYTKIGSEFQVNTYATADQQYAGVAMDADGDFVVVWMSDAQDGSGAGVYAQRYTALPPLAVSSVTPTSTGFTATFNRDFDASVLNLFDLSTGLGAADVTLTGALVGEVRGSVVVDLGSRSFTFIKTGGALAPDTYTINLRSSATGLVDASGTLLDGNGDGVAGDDYVGRFVISPPASAVSLAIGDIARGYSQAVNVPATASTGLPITISSALGIKSASFALLYDPTLLTISAATLGAGLSGSVSLNTTLPGIARITVTSGTQLSATSGLKTLVNLTASMPSSALYGAKEVLQLSSIVLLDTNAATIPALDDSGIHIAAYFGDANGSQTYNAPDATLAQRLIVGTDTLLPAYPLADPSLLADINSSGQVQSNDVTQIQRAIVGIFGNDIPTYPGLAPVAPTGPDPLVFIPQDLSAAVGQTITVPVQLLVTEPTGITLAGVDLAIAYDVTRLVLDDVKVGELLVGFGLNANLSAPGVIRLSLAAGAPLDLPFDHSGMLAELNFKVLSGSGPTRINLLSDAESLQTALYDNLGRSLLLQPAPSNEDDDPVDGLIEILAADKLRRSPDLHHE